MTELVRRLLRTPQGALGTGLVALVLLLIVVGPLAAPHDPDAMSPLAYLNGDWSVPNPLLGRFDLIVGSDVLYGRDQPAMLAAQYGSDSYA